MRSRIGWSLPLVTAAMLGAAPLAAQTLDIYFIDTEGGQATLYVSPSGESMLIDTGNPGPRDHSRIMEVVGAAGLNRIDHLVVTHYHGDHYGGVELLSQALPIGHYYDHGQSSETGRPPVDAFQALYAEIAGDNRTSVKPGDRIPFAGVDVLVVTSHGEVIGSPIPGAPGVGAPNPACDRFTPLDMSNINDPDNDMSVGVVITHGAFRTINLGDLTRNWEYDLMCPNKVGTIDFYLTSHHGLGRSGSDVLVEGLRPRAAVMNNGTRKGGSADALEVLHSTPGVEDVWQLHWSHHGLVEYNTPGMFIANIDEPETLANVINPPPAPAAGQGGGPGGPGGPGSAAAHSPAHYIKVSAQADGTFTVTNTRNGFSKTYTPRGG